MADVPDQAVARRVENVVQCDGQFDHTESGPKMAPGLRNRGYRLLAQLMG